MSINKIIELTKYLNICNMKYYSGMTTISDIEYDRLLDQLEALEKETGYRLPNSPTKSVGATTIDAIKKEKLPFKMLSLNKIKNDYIALKKWMGSKVYLMSIKVDGGACAIEYNNGKLVGAYTRGDGTKGSNITDIVSTLPSVPNIISNKEHIVIIGEICIKKKDFDNINKDLKNEEKYSNSRNLATATLLNLDVELGKKRRLTFYAFDINSDLKFDNQLEVLELLNRSGFMTALNTVVDVGNVELCVESYKTLANQKGIPIDGMVVRLLNREEYTLSGTTAKYPKGAIAFKFQDEVEETTITGIEYSIGRTGVLTPVLVIEPTEIYDTIVSRISGHNISYLKVHEIGIGDKIHFTKSNEIIPMLVENITKSNNLILPSNCPYCGSSVSIQKDIESEVLLCSNKSCVGIITKKIEFYVNRNNMNIKGLSEETIKLFIKHNIINNIEDVYTITYDDIINLPTFSSKKANNIINSIQESRVDVELYKFITSVGIDSIGKTTAKAICNHFNNNLDAILNCNEEELCMIDGISNTTAKAIISHLESDSNMVNINYLAGFLTFKE